MITLPLSMRSFAMTFESTKRPSKCLPRILFCLLFSISAIFSETAPIPMIIAHRGASESAPENTMSAFRRAWEEGADGIEGDFFLSSDGEVVCIHNKETKKTSSANLDVKKSTLKQLRALDYGSWKGPKFKGEKIPTLEEILDEVPSGKWFFLEIKDSPKIIAPIAKILAKKRPDKNKLVLISFDKNVIKACREKLPDYRACLLSSLNKFTKKGRQKKYLAEIKSCGSQGLAYKESPLIPKKWLAEARGENGILATWTVNQLAPALRATGLGVEFLITNRPAGLRAELEANMPQR